MNPSQFPTTPLALQVLVIRALNWNPFQAFIQQHLVHVNGMAVLLDSGKKAKAKLASYKTSSQCLAKCRDSMARL